MQSCTEESVRESVSLCTLVSGPARPLHRVWIRCERLEGWNQRRNALFSFFFFTNVLNNLKCSMLPFRTVNTLLTFLHDTKYFVVTGISDESIAMCLFCVMCFFFLCNFNSNAFLLFFFSLSLSSLWCYRYSLSNLCHTRFYQRKYCFSSPLYSFF